MTTAEPRTFTPDQVASGAKVRVNELTSRTMLNRIKGAIRGCGSAFQELCVPFEKYETSSESTAFREDSIYFSLCSFHCGEKLTDEIVVMFKTAPHELRNKEQFLRRRWHYAVEGGSGEKVLKYVDIWPLVDSAFEALLRERPELLHQILKQLQAGPGEKARVHETKAQTFRNMQSIVASQMANIDFG